MLLTLRHLIHNLLHYKNLPIISYPEVKRVYSERFRGRHILTSREDRFGDRIGSKILHDLGNLMFAFTIFWTYLSASQLIIIWPADLPQEIGYYRIRPPVKPITVAELAALPQTEAAVKAVVRI